MGNRIVIGLHVTNRVKEIPCVQSILTEFGCNIKTRLGLHQASDSTCSASGLLLLEMIGDDSRIAEMEIKLRGLEGLDVQKMVFTE